VVTCGFSLIKVAKQISSSEIRNGHGEKMEKWKGKRRREEARRGEVSGVEGSREIWGGSRE
jgi:hypothetical protein